MAFTDNFKKAFGAFTNVVGDAAKATADKAKDLADTAKLNMKISAEEDKIKKAQLELGKQYYNDFEAGIPIEGETYLNFCNEIKAAKEQIAQYRIEIEDLKKDDIQIGATAAKEDPAEEIVDKCKEAAATVEEKVEETVEEAVENVKDAIEFTVVEENKPEE